MSAMSGRVAPEARIDVPQEALSTVNFTGRLLEMIMLTAGHTSCKAGQRPAGYTVEVGKKTFVAPNPNAAFKLMLHWLLTSDPLMTPEQYAEQAASVLQMEQQETDALVEKLTEGGLTEFGRQVEKYRQERSVKLSLALDEALKASAQYKADELRDYLVQLTGYEDLELTEVVVALSDRARMRQMFSNN